jgi:hypothetical protein
LVVADLADELDQRIARIIGAILSSK